jgi:hypothetical protein
MDKATLQSKLQNIKELGYVETMRPGNTGVGYTLETLLGVEENNSVGADIEGEIELKAKRRDGNSRTTSFCQNPIWLTNSRSIIKKYGWDDKEKPERINFYPSLKYGSTTPQGLTLEIKDGSIYMKGRDQEYLSELPLEVMRFRFRQKFKKLVLVLAQRQKKKRELEKFLYDEAYFCSDLSVPMIEKLFRDGKIVIEPRMWMDRTTGKLRDRGVAIRMSDKWTKELFGTVERLV